MSDTAPSILVSTFLLSILAVTAAAPPWPASVQSGGETTVFQDGANAFSLPLANLDRTQRRYHAVGNSFFNRNWIAAPGSPTHRDGLGPLFNATSCSACHRSDGRGDPPVDGPAPTSLLFRLEASTPFHDWDSQLATAAIPGASPEGNVIIRYETITGQFADGSRYELRRPHYRVQPSDGRIESGTVHLSPRQAPPVFGLGLLEAIPLASLQKLADPDDANQDGISGRLNQVRVSDTQSGTPVAGRFGWKAGQPSLRQQIAAALLNDIGITSSILPYEALSVTQHRLYAHLPSGGTPEIEDRTLARILTYQETLAPPARRRWTAPEVIAGEQIFGTIACSACHHPSFQTGRHSTIAALSNQRIWPYTDLLIHDLGEELADHETEGIAGPQEWRTPPLWGIGLTRTVSGNENYLHDGRARTLEEAILWHGGEAQATRQQYKNLSKQERLQLLSFLQSL